MFSAGLRAEYNRGMGFQKGKLACTKSSVHRQSLDQSGKCHKSIDDKETGVMTEEAQSAMEFVQSMYPDSHCYVWGIGKGGGLNIVIKSDKTISISNGIVSFHRNNDDPLCLDTFKEKAWLAASDRLQKDMLKKLES